MRGSLVSASLLVVTACTPTHPDPAPPQSPVGRAAAFLWKQQAPDGGWHSHTYGLLRSGQSLTPFVLGALLAVPASNFSAPPAKIDQALQFIKTHINADGALGMLDPALPDYPNYATALAVSAMIKAHSTGWEPLVAYLRTQQFTEANGWHSKDPAYGAWGMGGGRRTPPDTGHVDLSMSRYVIEALRAAGVPADDPALKAARIFVERCQNFDPDKKSRLDGGFFFSTTEFDTNKAGHDGKHYRSYGTTTADGILALLALGAAPDDAHVAAASQWLSGHHESIRTPGFEGEAYQRWIQGLAFYYAAASTAAFAAAKNGPAPNVAADLEKLQKPDGSWSNTENLVKEDDPLIATGFALRALLARK